MALLPAALPLRVASGVDQQHPLPTGLQHPRAHVDRPVIPLLLQLDQAEVVRAVCKRHTPLVVVVAVAKEEEAGHEIVTKAKEAVEAGSITMV